MSDQNNAHDGHRRSVAHLPDARRDRTRTSHRRPGTDVSASQLRRQGQLAELGRRAMFAEALAPLLNEASSVAAGSFDGCFASIYEYARGEALLELRSSAGWNVPTDHSLRMGVEAHSVARAALRTGRPSVWTRLAGIGPAPALELWNQHGIRSAICVTIGVDQTTAYGVLEVCTREDVDFPDHESAFLQVLANTLAMAVDAHRRRQALEGQLVEQGSKFRAAEQALMAQRLLVQEGHHRIANSLQMLGSILDVQAKGAATGGSTSRRRAGGSPPSACCTDA